MKVLVGAFNQEKALVGAFSMIVKTDGWFTALVECVWVVRVTVLQIGAGILGTI